MKVSGTNINFKANKISKPQAEYINSVLCSSKSVDIICHEDTDRDSADSAVSIFNYLKQKGISSRIIISQNLKSLNLENSGCNFINSKDLKENEPVSDTAICMDFSSSERINQKTLDYIKKVPKLLCFDHHRGVNLVDHDYTYINKPLDENNIHIKPVTSFYIDSSAKSTTSILYRFYEALGEKIDNSQAYTLFSGLVDDGQKRSAVICDGLNGKIEPDTMLVEDKNAYEVFADLRNKLAPEQIKQIAQDVDLTSFLTKNERNFQMSLFSRLNFEKDGEIAYVYIPPNDEEWNKLGQDTTITSAILNKFRRDVINNNFNDDKLKKVRTVLTFYQADDKYRVSIHSKGNLHYVYANYDKYYKNGITSLGGHTSRGGGRILSTNEIICKNWMKKILDCVKLSNL